jgi:ADP-ribose pyrophosphatase
VREAVPDAKVEWAVEWPEYKPAFYLAASVAEEPVWADKAALLPTYAFDTIDNGVNRTSFEGPVVLVDGVPRNPKGRTGVRGRGLLGKFGPNHAADPIVTRWARDDAGEIVLDAKGMPVLELVVIQRKDNGQWALPGGMVDNGDTVSVTLKKEFGEEALNSLEGLSSKAKAAIAAVFADQGTLIYTGYVDDPRNTDDAWIETTAVNFHDPSGRLFDGVPLQAGDDAGRAQWHRLTPETQLYANHTALVYKTRDMLQAEFSQVSK